MVSTAAKAILQRGLPMISSVSRGNENAPVAKWLLGCSGVVLGIVNVGGITRLTKSGLSMTDWKPLGSLPPTNEEKWSAEFQRYKSFPEFQQRQSMTMDEFKYIYFWEWGHRMLGRFAGICFAAPFAYFSFKNRIPHGYYPRMFTLLTMGGTQGLIGWWMVKSGLGEERRGDYKEIRVSPYRLATHLSMAFSTYSLLLWTGLDLLHPSSRLEKLASTLSREVIQRARTLRAGSIGVTMLTAITAVSGAFVAGNDAGNAYNTFPKMADQWIPLDDMVDMNLQPLYRNFFENTATVQWQHRVLAISSAASIVGLSSIGLFHPYFRKALTPQARNGFIAIGITAVGQASLGITTLLNYVPITLAAAHQLGSLALLSSGIYLCHSLKYVSVPVLRSCGRNVLAKKGKSVNALALEAVK